MKVKNKIGGFLIEFIQKKGSAPSARKTTNNLELKSTKTTKFHPDELPQK